MIKGGPKIINDGLVLCLDAHDANSYAGEPTTNVVTYTDLNTGWSKGYQSNITYDEIDPPDGITSQVVGHTRGSSSGFWYSYGNYAPQVPNTVYTVSMYVKTLDSNFSIRFYTADNSETGRVWGSNITVPNDGKWHRVVWNSFTNPSNSQSDSLSFNFFYGGAINEASTRTWFCAPQMEAKSYATPFVASSRSATNGWVDRSGNSNSGTLTNMIGTEVTHYRDGQVIMPVANSYLDFDGSDDYIDGPTVAPNIGDFTYEAVIYRTSSDFLAVGTGTALGGGTYMQIFVYDAGMRVNLYAPQGLGGGWKTGNTIPNTSNTFVNNNIYHVTIVNDGTVFYFYKNGVSLGSYDHSYLGNTGSTRLGILRNHVQSVGGSGRVYLARMYNKALTSAEVLQNYNATKGRFS